jgi:hypothetical protein
VIRVNPRIAANQTTELLETLLDNFAGCIMISDTVQSDLKALVHKFQYEAEIFRVLQARTAVPSIGNARE